MLEPAQLELFHEDFIDWDWLEGYIPKEVFIGPLPKPWYKCTSIRPGSDIIINLRGAS